MTTIQDPKQLPEYNKINPELKINGIKYNLLDRPIQTLRPITLLEDNTKMILTYLATKTTNEKGESSFDNLAYFVSYNGKNKKLLIALSPELKEEYKVTVLPNWYDVRWDKKDLDKWLNEKEKTDPKILFELQDKLIKQYLDFPDEIEYTYFNLWNIATYFYELFDSFAYNDLTGTKRAGKSKVLEFQKNVCFNATLSADMSGSATFRIIEGLGSTVLLDESEQFKNTKNENAQHVRTLLNQGFLRDQFAIRSEGKVNEGFTPTTYNLFSPKSLAHIRAFDDVLEDRCIQTLMKRSTDKTKLNTWPDKRNKDFGKVRNLCYRLFLDYGDEVSKLQDEAKELLSLSGRELKLWTPIITLALFFQNHGINDLVKSIKTKTIESSEDRQIQDEEGSEDMRILSFCDIVGVLLTEQNSPDVFKGNPEGMIPTMQFYKRLVDESNASTYGINPEYYTRPMFTQSLRRLGFKQKKEKGGLSWLITRTTVDEVKVRMGMKEPPKTSALCSPSAPSSLSLLDYTNKSEHSEHSEPSEPKVRPILSMNKSEHSEPSELDENNTSALCSPSAPEDKT